MLSRDRGGFLVPMAILMSFSCAFPLSPSPLRDPPGLGTEFELGSITTTPARFVISGGGAASAAAANYKWLFVRRNRWLNGRERNRLINERQEERERERSRMDATTMLNKLFGRGKKGTAGRGGREKGKPSRPRPTRERHFQMQMKTEWSKKRTGEGEGEEQQKRNR